MTAHIGKSPLKGVLYEYQDSSRLADLWYLDGYLQSHVFLADK